MVLSLCAALAAVAAAPVAASGPGALDDTFDGGTVTVPTGTEAALTSVKVQPDGKLLAAGMASISGGREFAAVRFRADGTLDTSFDGDGVVTVPIGSSAMANAVALQPDGRALLAGTAVLDGRLRFAVVRLKPDGALDPSFANDGVYKDTIGSAAMATGVALQPDGKVVIGGTAKLATNVFAARRLDPDGTVDRTFGTDGTATFDNNPSAAWSLALQPDGKIVLAGEARLDGTPMFGAARLTESGLRDESFGTDGMAVVPIGVAAIPTAVVVNPDGSLVLAGSAFAGKHVTAAAKLTPEGQLDPSFAGDGVFTVHSGATVNAAARQPDGKVVLASTGMTTIRLTDDGELDPTFGGTGIVRTELGEKAAANGIALQSDGGIVLAGLAVFGSRMDFAIARLIGGPPSASVEPDVTQPDGEKPVADAPDGNVPGGKQPVGDEPDSIDDLQAPETKLVKGPPKRSRERTPTFSFTSSEEGSRFECALDSKRFRRCESPFAAPPLNRGKHVFRVRAVDRAGNLDPSAVASRFRVVAGSQPVRTRNSARRRSR